MARWPFTVCSHHNRLLLALAPDHESEVTAVMCTREATVYIYIYAGKTQTTQGTCRPCYCQGPLQLPASIASACPTKELHAHSHMLIPAFWRHRPTKPVLTALPLGPLLATLPAAPIRKTIMTHTLQYCPVLLCEHAWALPKHATQAAACSTAADAIAVP